MRAARHRGRFTRCIAIGRQLPTAETLLVKVAQSCAVHTANIPLESHDYRVPEAGPIPV